MIKIWPAALAAVVAAGLGLTGPARAPSLPSAPAGASGTSNQSLRSLDKEHPPGGSKRWVVDDPIAYAQAVKTGKWTRTPYGLSYNTCIYHAPNNATVQANKIISPSGAVRRITPCTHPALTNGGLPGAAKPSIAEPSAAKPGAAARPAVSPQGGPCGFAPANVFWAISCYGSDPDWIGYMSQEYAVPSDPAEDGALFFIWGGLENSAGNTLLQDVLTWGANGNIVTNPNIWYMTNWYLWPGNNFVISPSMHVEPVDTIVANLSAYNCDGTGDCSWTLQSIDKNDGATITLNVTSTVSFDVLLGAVLEVPVASGCVEMPSNGHAAFRDLSVVGINGDSSGDLTPDFGVSITDHQCSDSMTASPTAADILWKP